MTETLLGSPVHQAIVVDDLDETERVLASTLGAVRIGAISGRKSIRIRGKTVEIADLRASLVSFGALPLEIWQGEPGTVWEVPVTPGLHHLAYEVADVAAGSARLCGCGWSVEAEPAVEDAEGPSWQYLVSPWGMRVELTLPE